MKVHLTRCRGCGRKLKTVLAGAGRPKIRCAKCKAKAHRQRQIIVMRKRRAADPVYRELERYAVRKRMRARRVKLARAGHQQRWHAIQKC